MWTQDHFLDNENASEDILIRRWNVSTFFGPVDCAVEPVLSPVKADQPFRAAFVCTFSFNSLLNGRKSLRKKLNDVDHGPDLHSVHQSSKFMALGLVSHRLWGVQYARDARNTQLRWLNCARQWHWGCRGAGGSFCLTCKWYKLLVASGVLASIF